MFWKLVTKSVAFVRNPWHRSLMATANSDTSSLNPIEETLWKAADKLCDRFAESARLERAIRENLRSLGYEV